MVDPGEKQGKSGARPGAGKTIDAREKGDARQVARQEIEPGPTCQAVLRSMDIVDDQCFGSLEVGHPALDQMGETVMRSWLGDNLSKHRAMIQR